MAVEFVIRLADLTRATKELRVNREDHLETDSMDILVSECAATFRAVGTESEAPVNGKHPGTVRIPLKIWDQIQRAARTFKVKELTFTCEPGVVRIGKWCAKHPDIELGHMPDMRLSLPVDISVLDTLALARILTPEQLVEQDMRARVEEAETVRTRAVAAAAAALQPLGITEGQLQRLADTHLGDAADRLRRTLGLAS